MIWSTRIKPIQLNSHLEFPALDCQARNLYHLGTFWIWHLTTLLFAQTPQIKSATYSIAAQATNLYGNTASKLRSTNLRITWQCLCQLSLQTSQLTEFQDARYLCRICHLTKLSSDLCFSSLSQCTQDGTLLALWLRLTLNFTLEPMRCHRLISARSRECKVHKLSTWLR